MTDTAIYCNIHKRSDVDSCQVCEDEKEPLCFECGRRRAKGDYVIDLNDGEWAHEDCFVGQYSLCCGAIINSETGTCGQCRDHT